ncbi:peptidylprolyl isomerase [Flavobacterium sp. I3-2]|uniref:peptidylprolyl isomerase n=1 Tax=Flavobacterium sp. I3-2 TaxID=2748319 RepID=UPI0015AEB4FA|nr:peptidylprolyl isomerase [Flavobacterium sp. I3-2]
MKKVLFLILTAVTIISCNKKQGDELPNGMYAEIETSKGNILIELEYQKTPMTVGNFVALAEGNQGFVEQQYKGKPFYDGLKFHRVIADFMIQGGDPMGNGSGGPGYNFPDEIVADLKHDKAGVLSMANAGPGTNGSQFFITHNATPHLDGMHTVFGHVVKGQEIVNSIAQDDVIKKVTIIRNGEDAKKFDAPKAFKDGIEKSKNAQEEALKATEGITQENAVRFADAKAKATKTNSGLAVYVFEKGNGGKPQVGDNILIDYAGYFENGRLFDTGIEEIATKYNMFDQRRKDANQYAPIPFQFGNKTGLIPGFIEGFENMNYGDRALIFIPSHLAYGETGAGNAIPPNTDLIFELYLTK